MNDEVRRAVLQRIPYALFVVGARSADSGEMTAYAGNWLTQTSFEPPLVVLGARAEGDGYRLIRDGGVLSVNFLPRTGGEEIARHFFEPPALGDGTLGGVPFRLGTTGAPLLDPAAAWFEAQVRHVVEMGDHHVVVAEVVDAGVRSDEPILHLGDTPWSYGG